ncbi:MAG: carbohydrate ABC transporter permease, partial [Clostridia bacterium]|nr:carbohydrate ABC transporter permease [Clostridia bacterium]
MNNTLSGMRDKRNKDDAISDGMRRFNRISPVTNGAFSLIFILLAFLCLIPVIFVVIISFSTEASINTKGYSFLPAQWGLDAYTYLWRMRGTILRAVFNSIGITVVGTMLGLMLTTTLGYVLSRKNFFMRRFYIWFIFIPMLFNGGLLSTYVVNTQLLGLKDTYWALILPLACSSFYIIILRTFFSTT